MIGKLRKPGIRSRLIASIVLIIILPILLTLGCLTVNLRLLEGQTASQLNKIEEINRKLMSEIVASYQDIDQPEKFYQLLHPLLNKYQLQLLIINNLGQTLFDSTDYSKETQEENRLVGNQYNYNLPIVISEESVGTATIIPNPRVQPYNIYSKLMMYVLLSIGAGLFSLIALLTLVTRFITRRILHPLKELNQATQDVARGSLDFELKHKANDELGQFVEAFDRMRIRLKESLEVQAAFEESRKQLVANISHDLATPIAIIKGYVEGLEDGVARDEERFKRYLQVIKSKTEQLDRLIEDLAQYSQFELGRLEIKKEKIDSKDLFDTILRNWETSIQNSSAEFYVARPIPSVIICADKHRIEQVMDNLLKNAQRYSTKHPQIEVEIKTLNNNLQVTVKDNGIGVAKEDLSHVFELFYRGEKSRSRDYGGSGQGLAICKFIVEAHGGRIGLESTLGEGSAFFFTLPIP